VLEDAFDLGLDEIAEILSTSVGAVRAALHRGRAKLTESDPDVMRTPAPGGDAFCAAFNARDLERLTARLLDHATAEVVFVYSDRIIYGYRYRYRYRYRCEWRATIRS
jgi:RNA polymerase sigma-70 factor (ECF subfamily)